MSTFQTLFCPFRPAVSFGFPQLMVIYRIYPLPIKGRDGTWFIDTYVFPLSPPSIDILRGSYRCSSHVSFPTQLDDGWPESVEEEQGLLLLVWRHHLTKQYIKDVL
jgi:hypothetical protein